MDDEQPELAEIRRIIREELPRAIDWVEATPAWKREGRRARAALKDCLRRIRDLAIATGQQEIIDALECIRLPLAFGAVRPEELPNWNAGGSVN